MSRYVVPAFPKNMRRRPWLVLGALILALVWGSPTLAHEEPILRFEGRVTKVAPTQIHDHVVGPHDQTDRVGVIRHHLGYA